MTAELWSNVAKCERVIRFSERYCATVTNHKRAKFLPQLICSAAHVAVRTAKRHCILMILRSFIRIIIVYALVLGVLALPGFVLDLHPAASSQTEEATRHKMLEPVEIADHGHGHEDGEDYEQRTGHSHGHDPADHTHQVVFMSQTIFAEVHIACDRPQPSVFDLIKLETDFGIDRPPKSAERA